MVVGYGTFICAKANNIFNFKSGNQDQNTISKGQYTNNKIQRAKIGGLTTRTVGQQTTIIENHITISKISLLNRKIELLLRETKLEPRHDRFPQPTP